MVYGRGITISSDKKSVKKKYTGPNADEYYNNEKMIYLKNLSYIPKLIDYDDDKKEITMNYECCMSMEKLSPKERSRYSGKIKHLYFKFKKDTGKYLYDIVPKNLILNEDTGKIFIIDFEFIGKKRLKKHSQKGVDKYLKEISVI